VEDSGFELVPARRSRLYASRGLNMRILIKSSTWSGENAHCFWRLNTFYGWC
jgi:hypothetical protein